MSIVLDASVVGGWCLNDENSEISKTAHTYTITNGAMVPFIWFYELRNLLIINERRRRITPFESDNFLMRIMSFSILTDRESDSGALMNISRQYGLTVYDAAYLELALRKNIPIATLDDRLTGAAESAGAKVFKA